MLDDFYLKLFGHLAHAKDKSLSRMKKPFRILATSVAALLSAASVHAANFTWDTVPGDSAAITPGDGAWNTTAGNLVWNSAGTNVPWTNGNTAIFGGADGTYAISVAHGISTAGLIFNNSGYTLSAPAAATFFTSTSGVTVAAGKTATIGENLTLSRTGAYVLGGGGRLIVTGTMTGTTGASEIRDGTTLEIATGGTLNLGGSPVIGANSTTGITSQDGNMLISGGAVSITGTSNFVIGNLTSGTTNSVVTINAGSLSVISTSANGIRFGSNNPTGGTVNGTFNLDGGLVTAPSVTRISGAGVVNATFNFNGGTLRANKNNTTFLQNLTAANVKAGGARIDTNGFDITIAQALLDAGGGGGLEKLGNGTLTLTGANAYTGTTTISGGTLLVGTGGTAGAIGAGPIVNNGVLTINRSDEVALTSGISGSGVLNLIGAGTTTLGGTNSYTGATNIDAGRVDLTGSLTSNVTVASGADLGGEGSTTGSLVFAGTSRLFFDPGTSAHLGANTVDGTGAVVTLTPTSATAAGTGIVVINAPGGITGTAGTTGNFRFTGRGQTYLNGTATQLLFDYAPATLVWKGNDLTNPTFWDLNTTPNWDNAGTPDKFLSGDTVLLNDTATTFTVNVQSPGVLPSLVTFNNSANTYTLQGAALGGTGQVEKNGTGLVIVANDNTYSGGTTINAGTIQIGDGTNATGALGTGTVTNDAALVTNFGAHNATVANDIGGSGTLTQSGSGVVSLTGTNTYAGTTTISAGTLQIGDGGATGTLGSGAVVNNATLAFNRSGSFTAANAISGTGGVTKLGTGTLTLGTSNTYSGITTISGGAILVNASSGMLGDTAGGTVVRGTGAALQLQGGVTVAGESLTLAGDGVNASSAPGALRNLSGNNEWAGNINVLAAAVTRVGSDAGKLTISGDVTLSPITGDQFVLQGNGEGEISGDISGLGRLTRSITGTGTWTLSGANTYTGKTTISGGAISVSSINSVSGGAASSNLGAPTSATAGTIDFGNSTTTGALIYTGAGETTDRVVNLAGSSGGGVLDQSGGGMLKFTSNLAAAAGSKALSLRGSTAGTGEFAGNITNGSGTVGVTKSGSGTWTLSGDNSYTGATNITGGTLAVAVSGSISGSTSINISGGATFDVSALSGGFTLAPAQTLTGGAGTNAGTITGTLNAGADSTVAPGLGAGNTGRLTVSSGFSLDSAAHIALDITGTAAGAGYDQLIVQSGNITLAGDLAGSALTFTPQIDDVFYIILNNGAGTTTGTLGGVAEGGSLVIGAQEFQISYTSDFGGAGFEVNGAGNDVALIAVPEPTAASLLAATVALLGLRRRRRR